MKTDKKFFTVLIAICLLLSIVEVPMGNSAEAASDKTKITLKEGKSTTLKVKKVHKKIRRITWKSKNKKIATVSKKGKVKGKSAGNTKITAKGTLKNGKKFTAVYKVCVQKKKSTSSPKPAAVTKKPIVTGNPSVSPLPLPRPKIEAVSAEQGGMIGWKTFQADKVSYTTMYSKPDIINDLVASRNELMVLIRKLKAETPSTEIESLIKELDAYDLEYFKDHVLCVVNVQLTCGYRPEITQLYQKDHGGKLPNITVQYTKIKEYGDDQCVPDVMMNYLFRLEISKTALKESNGIKVPSVTAAPPSEKPTVNPTATPRPVPEIGTVGTAQGAVTDWKPIQTKSISCTELNDIPFIENQLITSYDALTALMEKLKMKLSPSREQIIAELEKYDDEYFQNHVLCLLAVDLTCGYTPNVKQVYGVGSDGEYADVVMQYEKIKEYGDDQMVPAVMMNYFYRLEIEKSEVMLAHTQTE